MSSTLPDTGKIDVISVLIKFGKCYNLTSDPQPPTAGNLVYNTADGKSYYANGTEWKVYTPKSSRFLVQDNPDS